SRQSEPPFFFFFFCVCSFCLKHCIECAIQRNALADGLFYTVGFTLYFIVLWLWYFLVWVREKSRASATSFEQKQIPPKDAYNFLVLFALTAGSLGVVDFVIWVSRKWCSRNWARQSYYHIAYKIGLRVQNDHKNDDVYFRFFSFFHTHTFKLKKNKKNRNLKKKKTNVKNIESKLTNTILQGSLNVNVNDVNVNDVNVNENENNASSRRLKSPSTEEKKALPRHPPKPGQLSPNHEKKKSILKKLQM
ncbi:hypothetical protein RFI_06650, partial [Reticulomyxa filosa]